MERKHVLTRRTHLFRRLTALFLTFASLMALVPQLTDTAEAASVGSWRWRFRKVTSQDQLPDDDAWHPVIFLYTYNNQTYVMDTMQSVGDSTEVVFQGTPLTGDGSSRLAYGAGRMESSGALMVDTYGGDFPYGIWMKYYGIDSYNWDFKQYIMRDSKDGSGILYSKNSFISYAAAKSKLSDTELNKLIQNQESDSKTGIQKSTNEDDQCYFPFTIMTKNKGTTAGKVKVFCNVAGGDDSCFDINGEGKVTLKKNSGWDFDEFTMYVGTREYDTSAYSTSYGSMTVNSGDSYVMKNGVIDLGATVTVKENATLIIQGNVYFNGTIENYGTVIVDEGSLQTTHYIEVDSSDETAYGCYRGYGGSSLIVTEGSCVLVGGDTTASGYNYGRTGTGIELYGGSLVNSGTVSAPYGLRLSGSADVINEKSGKLLVGYYYVPVQYGGYTDFNQASVSGNFESYEGISSRVSVSQATPSWNYRNTRRNPVVISCEWKGDQYPVVQNSGTIMANCGWINANSFPLSELTAEELAKVFLRKDGDSYAQSSNWNSFKTTSDVKISYMRSIWKNTRSAKLW